MNYLDWRDEFVGSKVFRPGDVFDFNGTLGILTERFDIYAEPRDNPPHRFKHVKHSPSWAWRVEFFPPSAAVPAAYNDEYGFSEINLYNIWKSKVVARGKKE